MDSFNQLLSIITVRQFRTHPTLSELTITDNGICNLGLLRLFVAFNLGHSLQKFNGLEVGDVERDSAFHLFSPLFREASDTKISGDVPSSPIPPKRKKHSAQLQSSKSPQPTSSEGGGGVTFPLLMRGASSKYGGSNNGAGGDKSNSSLFDPHSDPSSGTSSSVAQERTVSSGHPAVVWKPPRASSKLMTFELVCLHIHTKHIPRTHKLEITMFP